MPVALARRVLTVAVEDPLDFDLIDELRFICNLQIDVVVATANAIRCAVARHYVRVPAVSGSGGRDAGRPPSVAPGC